MPATAVPTDAGDGSAATWTLLLGATIELRSSDGRVVHPTRKAAGLLAVLALSGAAPRQRLAELLWPAASDPRNSLRQALHQFRGEAEVIAGTDPVGLAATVDVVDSGGDLLAAFEFEDLPEFREWLAYERERRHEGTLRALAQRVTSLESDGRREEALDVARQAFGIDPLSEAACRTVMRLGYLTGDRSGALATYRQFAERLAHEFQLRPLPETTALARDIERASVARRPDARQVIPVNVDRPPLLVGREAEWERMERAWEEGRVIYLSGPPGVGKTRLMQDFAASKVPRARWNVFTARPGDMTAPYASQARAFRAVLDACPGIELTPAMRRELSRLLPGLAEDPPPPMSTQGEKNYFYATLAEVLIRSGAWLDCWVADDWQFIDAASLEMANYMFANVTPVATDRKGQRAICTFRTEEVGDAFRAFLSDLERGGIAIHIELPPLDAPSVERLLASTEIEGARALGERMQRFTGGNPLFIVETLKSLLESEDGPLREASLRDSFPRRVAQVFEERFRRLGASELRLIRLLAVAQTDASAELAGIALDEAETDIVAMQSRLEEARLLDGFAFRHDLVYEAAERGMPAPLRRFLHRRVASALVEVDGPAARIAYHYETAGEPARALPYLLDAAEDAQVRGAFAEAQAWFARVRDRDDDPLRVSRANDALQALADVSEAS